MTNEHTTNNNKTDLTLARAIYIGVWAATIVIAILYECHFLTEGYIKAGAETEYALNMLCVLFTLGGTWGSLKLFATKHVRTALHNQPSKLPQWNMLRNLVRTYRSYPTSRSTRPGSPRRSDNA